MELELERERHVVGKECVPGGWRGLCMWIGCDVDGGAMAWGPSHLHHGGIVGCLDRWWGDSHTCWL